ncbi:DJ-1/PfpI family protein [Mastigocoleus testarum]|uniref:Glutamine amidotransferase n=1 Tax=Mastigocoleus testarum BC008 TaxID=371196 RepID=A0A0V7ZX09_9CYAN|nr:DJ-1/PfpI family protein [Mastigocoleus testarum]KST68896.1 glutamine amidotransferase [Mastigocoleus testarum BC008]KST68914.1 glutamine amidotransferase [Mastigocoleus testarum BC008]
MNDEVKYHIGLVMYPGMTQLDLTGPHQVFAFFPNTVIHLIWKSLETVISSEGLKILPSTTFDDCPRLDVICVPGGRGQVEMMEDEQVLKFLRSQAKDAKYITSVCTGSMILAAAGLLQGYRAACHWLFRDYLKMLGVEVSTERVVIDRNRITGGGITAGIDFALVIAAQLYDEDTAKRLQLILEYNPAPPFNTGSPETAGTVLVGKIKQFAGELLSVNLAATERVSKRLSLLS